MEVLNWDMRKLKLIEDRKIYTCKFREEEKKWQGEIEVETSLGKIIVQFEYNHYASSDNGGESGRITTERLDGYNQEVLSEVEKYFEGVFEDNFKIKYIDKWGI